MAQSGFHEAEVAWRGSDLIIAKRCHQWRAEGRLRLTPADGTDGKSIFVAYCYFGMGTEFSHPEAFSFVVFGNTYSVMLACIDALGQYGVEGHLAGIQKGS